MPFITLYLPRGCEDSALETAMREITAAGAELLENTLERMIRVTVLETDSERVYQGGMPAREPRPFVLFRVGPGRSGAAKDAFMVRVAESLHRRLGFPQEDILAYVMDHEEGHHFCIGGKHKDFTERVK